MELREKIANVLIDIAYEGFEEAYPIADAILAIPEIASGLELLKAQNDMLFSGTSFVRVERIPPEDVFIKPSDDNA